jgi:hypothetical protein
MPGAILPHPVVSPSYNTTVSCREDLLRFNGPPGFGSSAPMADITGPSVQDLVLHLRPVDRRLSPSES